MSHEQSSSQEHNSVTGWFSRLQAGDAEAVQQLWDRYALALVNAARKKLGDSPRAAADEEDVVVSVFVSLCRGANKGRFKDIRGWDDLWWLLVAMTHRKAISQLRRETAEKRGGWREAITIADSQNQDSLAFAYDKLISDEPTPEYAVMMQEEHSRLLGLLRNDGLRAVACLRLEGLTVAEMAGRLGIGSRSVERKLKLIRQTWSRELDS